MRSTISIAIAAPPRLVFDLARDVERWPALLTHYVSVTVLGREPDGAKIARMVALRTFVPVLGLSIPVAWRSRVWSEPDALRLRFVHRGGATNGMDVTWRLEPTDGGAGAHVEIEHDFRPRFTPWAPFIDRLFVRPIAGRTLRSFKAIAEAVATGEASDPPPAANPLT
jgi:ribosome-associated toxin RatA of RatAB toxin-antitoxin module